MPNIVLNVAALVWHKTFFAHIIFGFLNLVKNDPDELEKECFPSRPLLLCGHCEVSRFPNEC